MLRILALAVLCLSIGCETANSRRVKVSKVYHLIADDGTMIEVSLKEYAKAKVGQKIESADWE